MRYVGVENQLTQPIYDTMQLAAAAGQMITFFSIPYGGAFTAAIPKTYLHTNLVQAGRLEKGLELTIQGCSFHVKNEVFAEDAVLWADYTMIYNQSWFDLKIGQVSFLRLPATLIPPGPAESNYFSNIVGAPAEYKASKGIGTIHNIFVLDNPLVLADQESIQVEMTVVGTPGAVTDVMFVLWGQVTRPVR